MSVRTISAKYQSDYIRGAVLIIVLVATTAAAAIVAALQINAGQQVKASAALNNFMATGPAAFTGLGLAPYVIDSALGLNDDTLAEIAAANSGLSVNFGTPAQRSEFQSEITSIPDSFLVAQPWASDYQNGGHLPDMILTIGGGITSTVDIDFYDVQSSAGQFGQEQSPDPDSWQRYIEGFGQIRTYRVWVEVFEPSGQRNTMYSIYRKSL